MSPALSRILAKIQNSYWLTSGFYGFLSKGSSAIFGFVNFYILIRLLTWDDYGAWVLFVSICTIMEMIKHGFIRNPLIRFLSISPVSQWPDLQSASLALNIFIGLWEVVFAIAGAYTLSKFWNVPQLQPLFLLYVITTIALIPANHFEVVQQAGMKFKELFFSTFVRYAGPSVFVLTALVLDWKITLESLAIAQGVSVLFSCLLAYLLNPKLYMLSGRINFDCIRQLFHYGKFTFGTNVSSMVVKNTDSWMLGKMISIEAVTIFNPSLRLSNLVEIPTDILTLIYYPRLSKDCIAGGLGVVKNLYEKAVAAILSIMIPVVIIIHLSASQVLYFIAGPGFEQASSILKITMLYGLMIPFNRFFGVTLDAIGEANVNFRIVLITALLNIVANLIGIKYFGIIGAAYGTFATYFIMVICNQIYLRRRFGVSLVSIAKNVGYFYQKPFKM